MTGRFYLILSVLSVILPDEICASLEKSFDTLVRKKRLIDNSRQRIVINSIHQVPYIVSILKGWESTHCAGTILSPIDILTVGHCFSQPATYHVVSNTIIANQGIRHYITNIKIHEQYNRNTHKNDLALLTIYPTIDFVRSGNRPIPLHNERNPITSIPVTSGWGCTKLPPTIHEAVFHRKLQSMTLPIISENLCKQLYFEQAQNIDDKEICTRDPFGLKTSCYGDSGNPLVANNHLLGIMSHSSNNPHPHVPDIFIKVYHHTYVQWIRRNMHYCA